MFIEQYVRGTGRPPNCGKNKINLLSDVVWTAEDDDDPDGAFTDSLV